MADKEQIMINGVDVSGCRKKKLNKIVSYENYAEIHINSKTYGHYIALVDIEDLSNLVSKTWRVVKQCRICGKFKKLSAFYKNPLKKLGRFDECKECIKERRQQNVDRKRKAGVKASVPA